jgi:hypothetical protein
VNHGAGDLREAAGKTSLDGGENIPAKTLQLRWKFASQTWPSTCILITFIAEIKFVKWSIIEATYQQTVEKSPLWGLRAVLSESAEKDIY